MRFPLRNVLAILSLCCLAPDVRSADIFVFTNDNASYGGTTNFGRIDVATGTYTQIAAFSNNLFNLAWNPATSDFYITEGVNANTSLRTITTTGTMSASIGTIGRTLTGMAYRTADNTLYGYSLGENDTGKIDAANGSWTVLNTAPSTLTGPPIGGRYSISNDTMYFASAFGGGMTGIGTMGFTASSTFQQIATNSLYFYVNLASDGQKMYGIYGNGTAGQQQLYTIDVVTGIATAGPMITGVGLGTYFHGAAMMPVPEPSTYVLGTIATSLIAAIARRRARNRG